MHEGTGSRPKTETLISRGLITMKHLNIIIAAFVLLAGTIASRAAGVDRISAATGVPVATLQAERASTGLGWGGLEKAHLLANATGQSFDSVVGLHQSGQGWGKIAHDNGLNLGRLVSSANRSSHATMHAKNTGTMHGRSGTHVANGHGTGKSTTRGFSGSHRMGSHTMGSMGHMGGGMHSMGMGHGGGHGR
jgi:hypothetical protein